ncbi:MAG: FAD-binding oxidoreductase, partial [Planctomycetota bacterium]|nr:FAD-binding oxidoreductase [Planctomycetota bacterium]
PLEYPAAVVWPESVEQIQAILRVARAHHAPIIPYGAGSGVTGGTVPDSQSLIVDTKRLNQILKIDAEHLQLEAQVGILGEILERRLAHHNLTLGHSPSSINCSTLGGWLATRSAGQLSTRYGKIEDNILSLRAILADGSIFDTTQIQEFLPGLDAPSLLVGSEGTAGILVDAQLRLFPAPASRSFRGISYPNTSGGLEAIRQIMATGIRPAAVRLYDPIDTLFVGSGKTDSSKDNSSHSFLKDMLSGSGGLGRWVFRRFLQNHTLVNRLSPFLPGGALLILSFEGEPEQVNAEVEDCLDIAKRCGGKDLGDRPGKTWWERRHAVSYKQSPVIDRGAFVDTMEVAATWDKLERLHRHVRRAISKEAIVLAHFSHAYASGCAIYFTFIFPACGFETTRKRYLRIWDRGLRAALRVGGTISHHHGVGMLKKKYALQERTGELNLLSRLTEAFDPDRRMNPARRLDTVSRDHSSSWL